MLVELSPLMLVVTDFAAWFIIHMAVAWAGTQLPDRLFRPDGFVCRIRPWEDGGRVYERLFRVSAWKDRLPDGAALFKRGFPKKSLLSRDPKYLARFVRETCRGEWVHWAAFWCAGLFFLWNPWYLGVGMFLYAALANAPPIITQRHNRARMARLLARMSAKR